MNGHYLRRLQSSALALLLRGQGFQQDLKQRPAAAEGSTARSVLRTVTEGPGGPNDNSNDQRIGG